MRCVLEEKLQRRKNLKNLRQLQVAPPLMDFASNDYLGLARSSTLSELVVKEVGLHATRLNGLGSTGSRLLTGNCFYAQDLEERIAAFHGYEAGLIFNCGYMANVGLFSAIMDSKDLVFFDASSHASTRDGIRLSRAKAYAFRHHDMAHLEKRLKNAYGSRNRFICVESIYSTDGSRSTLQEICELAMKYEAHLIVDEAHATGICGPGGRGVLAELNLTAQVFAQITTFGKALGVHGAIVMGSCTLKQALINFSNAYIYTTALPLHSLAAIKCAYDLLPKLDLERIHVAKLINIFHHTSLNRSQTHIQSIPIQGNQEAKYAADKLSQEGFDIRPLLSPTVQRGHEMLRISLHAFNTEDEVKLLIHHLDILEGLNA
jgi:8-amino-7-oxononanoate synthase